MCWYSTIETLMRVELSFVNSNFQLSFNKTNLRTTFMRMRTILTRFVLWYLPCIVNLGRFFLCNPYFLCWLSTLFCIICCLTFKSLLHDFHPYITFYLLLKLFHVPRCQYYLHCNKEYHWELTFIVRFGKRRYIYAEC